MMEDKSKAQDTAVCECLKAHDYGARDTSKAVFDLFGIHLFSHDDEMTQRIKHVNEDAEKRVTGKRIAKLARKYGMSIDDVEALIKKECETRQMREILARSNVNIFDGAEADPPRCAICHECASDTSIMVPNALVRNLLGKRIVILHPGTYHVSCMIDAIVDYAVDVTLGGK